VPGSERAFVGASAAPTKSHRLPAPTEPAFLAGALAA